MDTVIMIERAKGLGLSFAVDGDRLKVTGPKTPAASSLVQQLAQHKAAVIDLLQRPMQPAPSPTAATVDELPRPEGNRPLPPIRYRSTKPPLPADKWVTGATAADAWAAFQALKQQYFCAWGRDSRGFTVTCDPVEFEVTTA